MVRVVVVNAQNMHNAGVGCSKRNQNVWQKVCVKWHNKTKSVNLGEDTREQCYWKGKKVMLLENSRYSGEIRLGITCATKGRMVVEKGTKTKPIVGINTTSQRNARSPNVYQRHLYKTQQT